MSLKICHIIRHTTSKHLFYVGKTIYKYICTTRNGGILTPVAHALLNDHIQSGHLEINLITLLSITYIVVQVFCDQQMNEHK